MNDSTTEWLHPQYWTLILFKNWRKTIDMWCPEPAGRNAAWIKSIIFNSKCFNCNHFPLIRRQCCKKKKKLTRPFICSSCACNFIIILVMENCRASHGNKAYALSRRDTQVLSSGDSIYPWSRVEEEIKKKTEEDKKTHYLSDSPIFSRRMRPWS